jgi:hypothetical protein
MSPCGRRVHLQSLPPTIVNRNGVVPTWDRQRQELRVGLIIVKRFRVPAISQETILAAFEEESWPPHIDAPLPQRHDQSPKPRLQETIKSLNRNQKCPLVRFLGDGSACRGDHSLICSVSIMAAENKVSIIHQDDEWVS